MIEPKSTDLNRRIICQLDRDIVPATLAGFDQDFIFAKIGDAERAVRRHDVDWEEVALARRIFVGAGLTVEAGPEPIEVPLRVSGWFYWPVSGMFQRPDGRKGSGGAKALVNALRGGTVPAASVGRPVRIDPAAAAAAARPAVDYASDVTAEDVRRIEEVVRPELAAGNWETVEAEEGEAD